MLLTKASLEASNLPTAVTFLHCSSSDDGSVRHSAIKSLLAADGPPGSPAHLSIHFISASTKSLKETTPAPAPAI
eukprot:CAMPEP_0182478976 /NCGR_PEP_ID=MMETSP1319-20130603/33361_1 /TAXON_ID=172717 /ORGANISM="Bolidomonas pacifica, Strain RCC208" /LENGTH=74 /DNA_ID=CAMNT_0024680361 /DNA_START=283 /DNA_END=504 /DNA_ORIENTATION=+